MRTTELGVWMFLSAMFVGGTILAAAHEGFGVFLMVGSFIVAVMAVAA